MRRREFITVLGGTAATWPLAASAQQREPLRRVAILVPVAKDTPGAQERYTAFLEAFEQLGWTDGRNVQIVVRWGGGNETETRKYAEEIVALAGRDSNRWRRCRVDAESYSHHSCRLCERPRSYGLRLRPESVATGGQRYRFYDV